MSAKEVATKVRSLLEERFSYASDMAQYGVAEKWRNMAKLVRAKQAWQEDCDGYALSAACLAVEDFKYPEEKVWLVACTAESGVGHLVCFISDDKLTWVVDNRQRGIWSYKQLEGLGYTWISALAIGADKWREVS